MPEFFGGFSLQAFLEQPIDVVVFQLILYVGWIPMLIVVTAGILRTWVEMERRHWRAHRPYILLAIDVPRDTEQSPKAVENIFAAVVGMKSTPTWLEKNLLGKNLFRHSFEIAAADGYIQFYIWTEERYRDAMEAAVYSQYPDAEITQVEEDYTQKIPQQYPDDEWELWGSEYVLDNPSYLPIRTWVDFEHAATAKGAGLLKDPLVNIFERMSKLRSGEQMWIQVLVRANSDDWKKEGDAFINKTFGVAEKEGGKSGVLGDALGMIEKVPSTIMSDVLGIEAGGDDGGKDNFEELYKAFKVTEQEREITKAVVRKIAKPGLETKIRYIYAAKKHLFNKPAQNNLVKTAFKQLQHGDLNKFGGYGAPDDDYFWQIWMYTYYQNKIMRGFRERSMEIGAKPYVLNTEELATIWHFPTIDVKVPLIKKTVARKAEPPSNTPFASEDEEMMMAPSMILPAEPEEDAPVFDDASSVGTAVQPDMRMPAAPHESSSPSVAELPVAEPVPPAQTPTSAEPGSLPTPTVTPPAPKPRAHVPDAIRVLVESGVEPEDVGIHQTNQDERGTI